MLYFLNYTNNCNTDLKSIHAIRHGLYLQHVVPLDFIGDTDVRTTTDDFESTGFIGNLKGCSGMTPHGMLLDRRETALQDCLCKLFCRC